MTKKLAFTFVDAKVTGIVTLHEKHAPVTCATMWKAFKKPARSLTFHAAYSGPEIMWGMPKSAQVFDPRKIPNENQTVIPKAGDVLWFFQHENMMKGMSDEFWEVGVFYDAGGRIFGPLGWTPVNIFATMTEGLERFAEECRDIRLRGAKMLEIRRA